MIKKWVAWLNYGLSGLVAALLLTSLGFLWASPAVFFQTDAAVRKSHVPKGAFARSQEDYDAIGSPALSLAFSPLNIQLPDLRRHLIYYGKNGRPDAQEDLPMLYFAFTGNKAPSSVSPSERLYVMYDKKQTPPQYIVAPNNEETPLWIEASAQEKQALVKVAMKGENGQYIREPSAYAEFVVPEKEYARLAGTTWELGKWRVDGTLLARQKARWVGLDRFLEKHGGEEYKACLNKQRIDFDENDQVYSVYVSQGDCLIWNNDRWQAAVPGENTSGYPLINIKKIEDRVMNLELWDVDGKGKVVLNLIKTNEAWVPQNLENNFKFVGARTRSQFVFEVNNERMLLSPHDWLVLVDGGWKKLTTPQEIDDYVDRKIVGPLFIFDQIERKEDRQVILGTLFSAGRTEESAIELPLQQGVSLAKVSADEKKQKIKETNVRPMVKSGDNVKVPLAHLAETNDEDDEDED